jgi:hypothetical protein
MSSPLIEATDLRVSFGPPAAPVIAVDGVGCQMARRKVILYRRPRSQLRAQPTMPTGARAEWQPRALQAHLATRYLPVPPCC